MIGQRMEPPPGFVERAVAASRQSPCAKSKRGVVIWKSLGANKTRIVGRGVNEPAIGVCDGSVGCRQACAKICVHAEQAAILEADLTQVAVGGFDMLHIKTVDGLPVAGGPPSCHECSKLIVASGIGHMWLLEEARGGWVRYTAREFHEATLENCGLHRNKAG